MRLSRPDDPSSPPGLVGGTGPDEPNLFSGPRSLRVKGERGALFMCLLSAPVTIAIIGLLFKAVTVSDMMLLIVAGMAYVSLSRGRLLGSSIRIHDRQFPELHAIVASVAERLGIAPPQIFVRDEFFVPITSVGLGEPYALMISSQYLEHLRPNELRFLIARELAHIAAGHTRLTSLLSASGRENFAIGLVFGSWLRRIEYTADRVGLICTDSISDAIGAIAITTFHSIGRRVDLTVLTEQGRDLSTEPSLRLGEWIGGMPYATNRIAALETFERDRSYAFWRAELERPRHALATIEAVEPGTTVRPQDLAPNWRRAFALIIDFSLLGLIFQTALKLTVSDQPTTIKEGESVPAILRVLALHGMHIGIPDASLTTLFGFFAYSAILVGLGGQTLGMMIADVRVVTAYFEPVGLGRTIWRYAAATFSLMVFPIALLGIILKVHVHDRVSGTRLVRGRAVPTAMASRAAPSEPA